MKFIIISVTLLLSVNPLACSANDEECTAVAKGVVSDIEARISGKGIVGTFHEKTSECNVYEIYPGGTGIAYDQVELILAEMTDGGLLIKFDSIPNNLMFKVWVKISEP